eukprot:TRINITY_DN19409_c0_g1_i1.p1 TRINITY_DN19409_c0_g1~~TRINITY_DN19409_c0_g1_i1.p1  ORF type:complete len:257 (+),score=37.38 TRINITY_DN19409_c0_g1_i1:101-871(+)
MLLHRSHLAFTFAVVDFASLQAETWENCSYEVVMMDDRPWNRLSLSHAPYWVMAAALNYHYASRFGYRFRFVQPFSAGHEYEHGKPVGVYPGWDKVMYFAELLQDSPPEPSQCSWLLYLDSDAFFRETDLGIPAFLEDLARRYRFKHVYGSAEKSVIFAQEQPMEYLNLSTAPMPSGSRPAAAFLNTGVFLVRADVAEAWQLCRGVQCCHCAFPGDATGCCWRGEYDRDEQPMGPLHSALLGQRGNRCALEAAGTC